MTKENNDLITASPCVGICSTTYGDNICLGCHRTYMEVIKWNDMTDEEKHKINLRLMEEKL